MLIWILMDGWLDLTNWQTERLLVSSDFTNVYFIKKKNNGGHFLATETYYTSKITLTHTMPQPYGEPNVN